MTLKQSNTTIRGLLFQPLLAGLVCGMVWGWLQAARLALTTRHVMSLRQWSDILSYAGLSHGLLWMLHGLFFGGLCAVLLLALPGIRRSVRSGALAVGLFLAGALTFQVWCVAAEQLPQAQGLQVTWLAQMAICWGLILAAV